jgi:hypothetical protein
MTDEATTLLVSGDAAYAVPRSVLEMYRATPEQRAAIARALGDGEGSRLTPEEPLFLTPPEVLEPYRLPDERRAALVAAAGARDDVAGHGQYIGQFPALVLVEPAPTFQAQFSAFGRPHLWVSPQQARDPNWNRNAGYYPKLN